MAPITKVGVIGAGTMGNGIAQVFAQSGFEVTLCDAVPAALDRAKSTIEKSLGKFVEKGKLAASRSSGFILPFSTNLPRLFSMPPMPLSRNFCSTSRTTVSYPA